MSGRTTIGERLSAMERDLQLLRESVQGMATQLDDVTAAVHIARGKRIALALMGSVATAVLGVALWAVDRFSMR